MAKETCTAQHSTSNIQQGQTKGVLGEVQSSEQAENSK